MGDVSEFAKANHEIVGYERSALATDSPPDPDCFNIRRSFAALQTIWTRQAAKSGIQIVVNIAPEIYPLIEIDAARTQHCLTNFMSNAVKFSKGGIIRLVASLLNQDNDPVLALSLVDQGCGIDPNLLPHIFTELPNERERRQMLGFVETSMPFTKTLADQFGGKIQAISTVNIGSVFSLTIPYRPITNLSNYNEEETSFDFSDRKILVVDDYHLNQLTIKTLLEDHVGKIYCASNGFEALELLHSCPVDLIFMDIHMPILDGIETTIKIRESQQAFSKTKIVALTADPEYHHLGLCRKIGMDGTLAKPVEKSDLLHVLREQFCSQELDCAI